jgi:hypothetical protein
MVSIFIAFCFGGMNSTVLQADQPAHTEHFPHYFAIVMLSLSSQGGLQVKEFYTLWS